MAIRRRHEGSVIHLLLHDPTVRIGQCTQLLLRRVEVDAETRKGIERLQDVVA